MAQFERAKPSLKQQPEVLVICEDKESGKRYLEDASRHFRIKILVDVVHIKSTPIKIVKHAQNENKKKRKYDRIFCVIDRDTHETFDEAVALAKTLPNVTIIASYPCYEFWLLLHFISPNDLKEYKPIGKLSIADVLIKDLCKYEGMENYEKGNDRNLFEYLFKRPIESSTGKMKKEGEVFQEARKKSLKILENAKARGKMNPSTQLHELLDFFETLSNPQKITP
jgi:hypothetical protein